jgi:enterochelin esterase-like enzyme
VKHDLALMLVELREADGGHERMVWRDMLPDALQFMNARIADPK